MSRKSIRRRTPRNQELKVRLADRYKELWHTRPHISEISGTKLDYEFGPGMFFVFSHVCSRGQLPREEFQLMKLNICFMTYDEHQLWEFHTYKIKDSREWKWLFELKDYIHSLYYKPVHEIIRYIS